MKSIHLIFYNPNFSFLRDFVTAHAAVNVDNVIWAEACIGIWQYKLSANSLPVLQHGEDSTDSTSDATLGPFILLTLRFWACMMRTQRDGHWLKALVALEQDLYSMSSTYGSK